MSFLSFPRCSEPFPVKALLGFCIPQSHRGIWHRVNRFAATRWMRESIFSGLPFLAIHLCLNFDGLYGTNRLPFKNKDEGALAGGNSRYLVQKAPKVYLKAYRIASCMNSQVGVPGEPGFLSHPSQPSWYKSLMLCPKQCSIQLNGPIKPSNSEKGLWS